MSHWLIRDDSPHLPGLLEGLNINIDINVETTFGRAPTSEGLFQTMPRPASYNWGGYIPRGGILDELDRGKIHLTNEP